MEEIQFKSPVTMMLSGCTRSGKTTFIKRLLENLNVFDKMPERIYYFYGIYSPAFQTKSERINFIEGLPDDFTTYMNNNRSHTLIVIDDLQKEVSDSSAVEKLFTRESHHRNLSVCLLLQNIFYQGKIMRTLALNSHVIILFKNPRSNSQLRILQSQLGLKHLLEAYNDIMKTPYSYLVVDCSPDADPRYQLRTHVFPGEVPIIFQ